MHKMWSFSTLQRPTQEEKERRRKYREEKIRQHASTLLPKGKVGRAKTFRERNNNELDSYDQHLNQALVNSGPTSLPVSASMVEVLRHRAKSASRVADTSAYEPQTVGSAVASSGGKRNKGYKDRDHSAHTGFVSRLRFLDSSASNAKAENEPSKLRWQDREPSSGYSSGGRGVPGDPGVVDTSDDNIYGVKFASMPPEVFMAPPTRGQNHQRGCGPSSEAMVSRRKILSRSRDDLHLESGAHPGGEPEEEDIWFNKDKLYKEHIQEVLNKWQSIDDEIWAKIIVLERNRRVAKAYARAPVLTVNGSDDGFDGFRIGLAGFENPMRDKQTEEVKRAIGQGCKIKMDDSGNILVKRIAKEKVYVKQTSEDNAIANDILKLPNGSLEAEKPVKLFDMKKFQQNVSREMRRAYPDRRKLECQCISAIAFVRNEQDILDSPCWIMLINIVAMDMLKSKMPPIKNPRPAIDIRNRPRIPVPDEDPYSIAGSGSSGSSGNGNRERSRDKPPKLPPRDNSIYATGGLAKMKPDYDHMQDHEHAPRFKGESRGKQSKKDDPYYCGLRARIPNFAKSKVQKEKESSRMAQQQQQQQPPASTVQAVERAALRPTQVHGHPMAAWHHGGGGQHGGGNGAPTRGYLDNVPPVHPANMANAAAAYASRNRPFERNPTTWVPPSAPQRNAVSEWESYWQNEN